ncbi:hypothetical protein [Streptomyces sp. t39]|uniref:hypothetical protein n=1 Tax=Streptomyces sp. t39 TaxID=1828156 RepID=UPI0011CE1CAC|nr:hypothetical protein [Streptomyces sp. t39]TXS50165.1 hypothetical protein EAO77_28050 [Streptomyces sp. t39]
MNGRVTHTVMDDELAGLLEDLDGLSWVPGVDLILAGIREAATAATDGRLDTDTTSTLLSAIANPHGPDLTAALAHLAQHLTSTQNRALDQLDPHTAKKVAELGERHAHDTALYAPKDGPNEAAGLIYPST